MRLFVALSLPEDVRDELARLAHGLPGARWVAAENLHLTLRFIGEVDADVAHDIDAALAAIRSPAFSLALAGIDRFGDRRNVRQLWVGADPQPALGRLQAKVEAAVVRAGLKPEGRKFKPHVTLARFKGRPGPKLGEYLSHNALFRLPPFEVSRFILYSSFLSSGGSIYTEEAAYDLTREPASV